MAEVMTAHTDEEWVPADTFGARLALVRQALGLNVTKAAARCGVEAESWRLWEHGRSPRHMDEVARRIADGTGVNYVWLLTGVRTGSSATPLVVFDGTDTPELPLRWGAPLAAVLP